MCRIEERIYVRADGNRTKFEETFHCDQSRNGKLCAKVNRRTTEYYPKTGLLNRHRDSPSPIHSSSPNKAGTYVVQTRRPSTRDGQKVAKPEIIIEFGSTKTKGTKHHSISLSSSANNNNNHNNNNNNNTAAAGAAGTATPTTPTASKRPLLAAISANGNDHAIDSASSDASHTLRTGFPDAPLSPSIVYSHTDSFLSSPDLSRNGRHRYTSSASSFTGSSRTPSLYVTSDPDYDSPTGRQTQRHATIIHNPPTTTTTAAGPLPSSSHNPKTTTYRIELVTPQDSPREPRTPEGMTPLDLSDRSSYASSAVAETRRRRSKDRSRQHELDRLVAEKLANETVKQVRFDLDRSEARDKLPSPAEREPVRNEDRKEDDRRELASLQHDPDSDPARKRLERSEYRKEKPKSSTKASAKHVTDMVKPSMTPAQLEERARLLAAEGLHMQGEREASAAREREDKSSFLHQQEQPGYYDPRGGNRSLTTSNASVTRRASVSRRHSITAPDARTELGRSNSGRGLPPSPSSHTQPPYSTRQSSSRSNGPPISFPGFNQEYRAAAAAASSARRPSYHLENPFAAPPTRGSASSVNNPFLSPSSPTSQSHPAPDPWDVRNVSDSLPSTRQASARTLPDALPNARRTNVKQATPSDRSMAARQATRAMGRAAGYVSHRDDLDISSEEERVLTYATRVGMGTTRRP